MTYIVYKTTNLINNKIYIGVHKTENPDIFDGYIGNGVNINKTEKFNYTNLNCVFHRALKKYGYKNFKRETLKQFDNLEDALDLERWLVTESFIKDKNNYNMVVGGGIPPTSTRCIYLYDINGKFIEGFDSIRKAAYKLNVNESAIGQAALHKHSSFGYYWSFKKINLLDVSKYPKIQSISVYVYDNQKKFIKLYVSLSECARVFGVHLSNILRAIKLGTLIKDCYISTEYSLKFLAPIRAVVTYPIFKYDLDGNFIKTYNSKEELKEDGYDILYVYRALRERSAYNKAQWIYGKFKQSLNKVQLYNTKRKVAQIDKNGNIIKIFKSVKDARKEFPNVNKVLKNYCKQCHGYLFKYVD